MNKVDDTKTPWHIVMLLFGAGILSAFQVGKVPPVIMDIRIDLGISLFYAGWILSIFNFTGLVMGTIAGVIADTFGHRRLMISGLALQIIGSTLGSFSSTYSILLVTRFIEGAGFLAVIVSTPALIFKIVKNRDVKVALSIWSCYLPAGASLMMILSPLILSTSNWRGVWQTNAFILFLYTIWLFHKTSSLTVPNLSKFTVENTTQTKSIQIKSIRLNQLLKDIIQTATSAGPLILAGIFITYSLQWLAVMGFLPTLIVEKFGFSKSIASLLTALMVFINIFGNLAGGRILKSGVRRWKLIAFASIVMGTCSIAIYSSSNWFLINYAGCLVFSIFGGLIPASVLGGVPLYAPSKKLIATSNGLVIQGGQTGQVLGPPVLAFLVSQTGTWESGSWFLGGVASIGVILSLFLARLRPKL